MPSAEAPAAPSVRPSEEVDKDALQEGISPASPHIEPMIVGRDKRSRQGGEG